MTFQELIENLHAAGFAFPEEQGTAFMLVPEEHCRVLISAIDAATLSMASAVDEDLDWLPEPQYSLYLEAIMRLNALQAINTGFSLCLDGGGRALLQHRLCLTELSVEIFVETLAHFCRQCEYLRRFLHACTGMTDEARDMEEQS